MDEPDGLAEWAASVPEEMRDDPIWRLPAYRYSLYLGDLVQRDIPRIHRDPRTRSLTDQMVDAVESISANIAEGYSRTTGPERAKFFEYAQSSARESRDWFFKVRVALDPNDFIFYVRLVTRVMKILTVAINRERAVRDTRARLASRALAATRQRSNAPHDAPRRGDNHPVPPSDQHEPPATS